jgi:hypothetical protein
MQPCKEEIYDCKQIETQLSLIMGMDRQPIPVHVIININDVILTQDPLLAPLATIPLSKLANIHLLQNSPGCFGMTNALQNNNYTLCQENRVESKFSFLIF